MEIEAQQSLRELQDNNPEVRLHAIEKLARFKDPKYATYLIDMMGDPEWRVRKTAVVAVTGLERNEALVEQLIQVCADPSDPDTKKRELRALVKAGRELRCRNLLVLTEDYEAMEKFKDRRIRFRPVWKWLLG